MRHALLALTLVLVVPAAALADAAEPLSVEASAPAAWVALADSPGVALEPFPGEAQIVARGAEVGLVRLGPATLVAVHRQDGFLAQLEPPPDAVWFGLDGADAVYVADARGAVFRARDVLAATRRDGFRPFAELPGAVAWDLTPTQLVGATGRELVVIDLETAQQRHLPLDPSQGDLQQLVARADGVLAALRREGVSSALWLSSDGASWTRSAVQGTTLSRLGQCVFTGPRYAPLVLTSDGRSWRGDIDPGLLDEPVSYATKMAFGPVPWASSGDPTITLTRPAAPPPPESAQVPEPNAYGVGGLLGSLLGGDCRGVGCVRTARLPEPPTPRTHYAFAHDGRCPAEAAVEGGWCLASAATQQAHLLQIDQASGRVEVVALPDGCVPRVVRDLAGAALLLCEEGAERAAVYVRDARGAWQAEGSIAAEAASMEPVVHPDGTLLLVPYYRRDGDDGEANRARPHARRLFVRAPRPLGAPEAWRELAFSDGLAARPAGAGAVIVVTGNADPGAFGVVVDRPEAEQLAVIAHLPEAGPDTASGMDLLEVSTTADGCIAAVLGEAGGDLAAALAASGAPHAEPVAHIVTTDGRLLPHADCAEARRAWQEETSRGRLIVRCDVAQADVTIRLDGRSDGDEGPVEPVACPVDVRLEPGAWVVRVTAEGRIPWREHLTVQAGESAELDATLPEAHPWQVRLSGGVAASDRGEGAQARLELAYANQGEHYEFAPSFRVAPGKDDIAYAGAVAVRYVFWAEDYEAGVGGGVSLGQHVPRAADEDRDGNNALSNKFLVDLGVGLRIADPVAIRGRATLYLTAPWLVDAGVEVGFSF